MNRSVSSCDLCCIVGVAQLPWGTHLDIENAREAREPRGWLLAGVLLVILNLFDGALTVAWVQLEVAREANVLWGELVQDHPVVFMAIKLAVVNAGVLLLVAQRRRRLAKVGLAACLAAYSAVFAWHLTIASMVL